jgi:hypothetical protein
MPIMGMIVGGSPKPIEVPNRSQLEALEGTSTESEVAGQEGAAAPEGNTQKNFPISIFL